MRPLHLTAALMVMTCLLASCGGGGDSNPKPLTEATCDSGTLWPNPDGESGLGIPNNSSGIAVTWVFQTCALQSVTSISLDICLTHPTPADLIWKITSPSSGSPFTVNAPENWNATETTCDPVNRGSGKFQRIDLLPTVQANVTTQGRWTLHVSDPVGGSVGTLVQWRLLIQGLR
jgi:subtilisin-like proprotein convertase family protein